MTPQIGLQLWSIQEETNKDFKGALKKVSEIGFQGVEFAGYGGLKSKELKETLNELNLKPCGSHVPLDDIINKIDEVIEFNLEINNEYIICPWANVKEKDDFIDLANKLNIAYEKFKTHGLKIGYHNHNHEFIEFDGKYGLDLIIDNTNKKIISELDIYWAQYAGVSPMDYINKYSGRFELIHIKDLEIINGEKRSTEIGNGILDIYSIVQVSKNQGTRWFIIEQEFFTKPCFESVKEGFNYLSKLVNN